MNYREYAVDNPKTRRPRSYVKLTFADDAAIPVLANQAKLLLQTPAIGNEYLDYIETGRGFLGSDRTKSSIEIKVDPTHEVIDKATLFQKLQTP